MIIIHGIFFTRGLLITGASEAALERLQDRQRSPGWTITLVTPSTRGLGVWGVGRRQILRFSERGKGSAAPSSSEFSNPWLVCWIFD